MTRAQAADVAQAATADAAELLGSAWFPQTERFRSSGIIVGICGDPRVGLGLPDRGLLEDAASPELSGEIHPDASPTQTTTTRTAVGVYRDDEGAQAAFAALGPKVLESWLLDPIAEFVRGDTNPDRISEPVPAAVGVSSQEVSAGDEATMLVTQFDENVFGGTDNTRDVALFVARSGSVVVTALAHTSSQQSAPKSTAILARRLGISALDHATAALD
jgi:hypothetical protein